MQQSKIDITVNEAPETDKPTKLSKVFKALANRLPKSKPAEFPTINGSNYFTGEVSAEFASHLGQMGFGGSGREDWKLLWRSVGAEPPGELPKGAVASLFVDANRPDCHAATSVTSVTKTGDKLETKWAVNYTPMAVGEERRVSFAVIILPKTKHPSSGYNYYDGIQKVAGSKMPPPPKA